MSELIDSHVYDNIETARTPLSGTRFYNDPLDANRNDDSGSNHLGCDSFDICGVASKHSRSEGGCNGTSLNDGNGIVGETPKHQESDSPDVRGMADMSPGDEFDLSNSVPYVGNDISSCIERAKVEKSNRLVGQDVPSSSRYPISLQIRQRRQMDAARRKASVMLLSDTSD